MNNTQYSPPLLPLGRGEVKYKDTMGRDNVGEIYSEMLGPHSDSVF